MAEKFYRVWFFGTYNNILVNEKLKEEYDKEQDNHITRVTNCEACGVETTNLSEAGSLARCVDCEIDYKQSTARAREYMVAGDYDY